ncbi:uncharacterized protein LOC111325003 [Stylophora pistillata]|uniref:uncharacterized protein LOC111325003 n=1 Tax=Stylophora pistillata TaxID=50429 RepID=UPI000C0457C8|nr:uncharacterized protein LOC111325003 [Stylophora pistillata]XP_022784423.1 uncharacterized protein LOC111325003 [Stylophora pistillata]XP_022784424.1 uncharacterized protein LOC111325003 [Stylophora pistillata]XP_022784425.1 uncharacterized protein LOC111325003 [Stylophora pistillata]XP_022784426.1 uncharacterized protein LOC111325003 [Stylophora pistillata]XP_022784427.1 uncharacterized protein LOC111325003 [Stylophora pistillata]XP_022784428.1 uncharacterized protein LOC111325003 [Stylop
MQHNPAVLILVQVVAICLQTRHVTEAAVVNNCTSPVHSTASCDEITYEQVYDILTKSENSFNIESALFPPKRPSSVLVRVNVYGPTETELSTPAAKYTWSISGFYAAFPAKVLEFWSLGAIQVTRRTQKLNITISISCCDVRKGILKKHIEDALAALEDLAVKPTLRDPRLNSAECIMEGHQLDITATGHSERIVVVLLCSSIFSVMSGPFLAFFAWQYRETQKKIEQKTMDFVCLFFLFIVLFPVYIVKMILVLSIEKENFPKCILVIQPAILALGIVFFAVTCCYSHAKCFKCFKCCKCFKCIDLKCNDFKLGLYIVFANFVAYHFCWLIVGIMLNPIWGLFVLLGICLFVGVFSYSVYQYCYSTNQSSGPENENDDGNTTNTNQSSGPGYGNGDGNTTNTNTNDVPVISRCQSFYWSFSCVLATTCLLIVTVLTGQSYNGKETADQVLKDVLVYLIPFLFGWVCWKNRNMKNVTRTTSPQPNPNGNPSIYVPLGQIEEAG